MKVLIAGDYCDNARVSEKIAEGNYASLFDDVKPVVESADFSIVNFEFPIVTHEGAPIPKCGPNLKGQKKSIEAIKYAGFNVCTLANNHILDQGESCCLKTKNLLEKARVKTVGVGDNIKSASEILCLEHDGEKLAVINCCEHEFSIATETSAGANPLNPIQQYYKIQEARQNADYVLMIVHGGHEHYQLPSPRMQETYRYFIDCGADAVVNHHQHCYSGYEVYKEKPIFYGVGNFCFDKANMRNGNWNEGFLLQIDFRRVGPYMFEMFPYVQCNHIPNVMLMNGQCQQVFYAKIAELNEIIKDATALKSSHEKWMEESALNYELLFQPYSTRIGKALFRHRMLPSMMSENKQQQILNYINCEAHLDRLRYAIKNIHK